MPKEPEVHPERQGRPAVPIAADMERRIGLVVTSSSSLSLAYLSSVIMTYGGEVLTHNGSVVYKTR